MERIIVNINKRRRTNVFVFICPSVRASNKIVDGLIFMYALFSYREDSSKYMEYIYIYILLIDIYNLCVDNYFLNIVYVIVV